MIQTSITALSSEIELQADKFTLDYPMGSYIPVWKIFRAFSKENHLIAKHIKSTKLWKERLEKDIFDIGSGDGLVLKELTFNSEYQNRYHLIEPNKTLLEEAKANLKFLDSLVPIQKDLFSAHLSTSLKENDLILLIHVLYLLEENSLTRLIEESPKHTNLIIVTDEHDSLFTQCWQLTAPKYASRSQKLHLEIAKLGNSGKVNVNKTSFKTFLKNPFTINRKDLQESLLSMISYSEFESLDTNLKIELKKIFDKHDYQNMVECESACYELKIR